MVFQLVGGFKKIQMLWHWNKGTLCMILWRFLTNGGSSRCRGRLPSVREVIGKCHACIPWQLEEFGSEVVQWLEGQSLVSSLLCDWRQQSKERRRHESSEYPVCRLWGWGWRTLGLWEAWECSSPAWDKTFLLYMQCRGRENGSLHTRLCSLHGGNGKSG